MNPILIPTEVADYYSDAEKIVFGPPAGVADEECGTVEILSAPYTMGGAETRVHHAYFRPNAAELEALNAGALIEVSQVGDVLQPFAANIAFVEVGDQAETDAILADPEAMAAIDEAQADMSDVDAIGAPDPGFAALVADEADPNRDKASGR